MAHLSQRSAVGAVAGGGGVDPSALTGNPASHARSTLQVRPRPRVLQVLGRMQTGGAEMRILEIMRHLSPHDFHVDVCAMSGLAGPLDDAVRACGGDVVPLRLDRRFPARFIDLVKRGRYDVVHSHVLHTSGAVLALAARAGVPARVAHFRATHDGRPSTLRRRAQRRVMLYLIDRYATSIVGCGEGALEAIWGGRWRQDRRCQVIYNSVDLTRLEQPVQAGGMRAELGVPGTAPLYIHVGREAADDQKNHRRLLQIFSEIQRRSPESWLVLAGAGTDDPDGATGRGIREFGLQAQVRPLGVRMDVPRLLRAADAMLMPSRWEGLPGAVLEACAVGLPVVASDIAGVREIAARLPMVLFLPLSASNAEWAEHALRLPAEADRRQLRDLAADRFRASVFHVDRAVEDHRALWSQAVRAGMSECS